MVVVVVAAAAKVRFTQHCFCSFCMAFLVPHFYYSFAPFFVQFNFSGVYFGGNQSGDGGARNQMAIYHIATQTRLLEYPEGERGRMWREK